MAINHVQTGNHRGKSYNIIKGGTKEIDMQQILPPEDAEEQSGREETDDTEEPAAIDERSLSEIIDAYAR